MAWKMFSAIGRKLGKRRPQVVSVSKKRLLERKAIKKYERTFTLQDGETLKAERSTFTANNTPYEVQTRISGKSGVIGLFTLGAASSKVRAVANETRIMELTSASVKYAYQKRGLLTAVLKEFERIAVRVFKAEAIYTRATNNGAKEAYEKLGFCALKEGGRVVRDVEGPIILRKKLID